MPPLNKKYFMLLKPKTLFLWGITVAIILLAAATLPYVFAWTSYYLQRGETNIVNVHGVTYMEDAQTSLINMTLVAVYPKAAVEAYSNMFTIHLAFLVSLDSNITEFTCYNIEVNFRSSNWTNIYYGRKSLSFLSGTLVNFYHRDANGNIQPFFANVSMNIDSAHWPPFQQDVSHILYVTDRIETLPDLVLNGRISMGTNSSDIAVFFDMTEYSTIVYRFNFPPLVWIAYGSAFFIIAAVSVNLFLKRRLETHP